MLCPYICTKLRFFFSFILCMCMEYLILAIQFFCSNFFFNQNDIIQFRFQRRLVDWQPRKYTKEPKWGQVEVSEYNFIHSSITTKKIKQKQNNKGMLCLLVTSSINVYKICIIILYIWGAYLQLIHMHDLIPCGSKATSSNS